VPLSSGDRLFRFIQDLFPDKLLVFLNGRQLFLAYAGVSMETYWKANEVAAVLQVSEQTIYRYVANGEIPFHKLSRAVRFKPSEIENWMESRKAANHNRNIGREEK